MTVPGFRIVAITGVVLLASCTAEGQGSDPADGAALFARHCASCHGQIGEGDGPVADAMVISVPNLRTLAARSDGRFPRDAVMRYIDGRDLPAAHGNRVMPVWGDSFADTAGDPESANEIARDRIAAITEFVERLQN
jgi:mono/diheme cytochrome c family protein